MPLRRHQGPCGGGSLVDVSNQRIVQLGSGSPRPLLLVYHLNARNDEALKAAVGPRALIVNDTTTGSNYSDTPSLSTTLAGLRGRVGGAQLSPVVLAGFSAGGFATARILAQGGDPDALVVADGTYATTPAGYADWRDYANLAKQGERVFLASNTSLIVPSSTWHILSAIAGVVLPLGPSVANRPAGVPAIAGSGPAVHRFGSFVIYSYPTDDVAGHEHQGDAVLPMMLGQAMAMLRGGPKISVPKVTARRIAGGVAIAGVLAGLFAMMASRR